MEDVAVQGSGTCTAFFVLVLLMCETSGDPQLLLKKNQLFHEEG